MEGKLAQQKSLYENQIKDLNAKLKALEGDPNNPQPVSLSQEEFDKLQKAAAEAESLKQQSKVSAEEVAKIVSLADVLT